MLDTSAAPSMSDSAGRARPDSRARPMNERDAVGDPVKTSARRLRPLTISLLYALAAALWILVSDVVLESWINESRHLALASTLKGWVFVLVSSLLLYWLLTRIDAGAEWGEVVDQCRRPRPRLRWQITGAALTLVVLTAGVALHLTEQEKRQQAELLQAIADLKVEQLAEWVAERLADAGQLNNATSLALAYQRWLLAEDHDGLAIVAEQLGQLIGLSHFDQAMLLDHDGGLLWRSTEDFVAPDSELTRQLTEAVRSRPSGSIGPIEDRFGRIQLLYFAVLPGIAEGRAPIVVLRSAGEGGYLPAKLTTWPLPSASGEIVLFRRNGSEIEYLSALRHQPQAALRLRLPIDQDHLLAGQLAMNPERDNRLLEGRDYRGKVVMGVGRAVAGTDWFLLAKIDRSEFDSAVFAKALWTILAGLLSFVAVTALLLLWNRSRQLVRANEIRQAQAERLGTLSLLGAIADASTDAIYAKDVHGRYILFNAAAGRIVGRAPMDVLGCEDAAIFSPADAEQIRGNDRRVMGERRAAGFEETLDTPNGRRTFLALKGPLIEGGRVVGSYGIARDISDRIAAENELRSSYDELRRFNEVMVGRELQMVRLKREINAMARQLGQVPPYPAADADWHLASAVQTGHAPAGSHS